MKDGCVAIDAIAADRFEGLDPLRWSKALALFPGLSCSLSSRGDGSVVRDCDASALLAGPEWPHRPGAYVEQPCQAPNLRAVTYMSHLAVL